MACCVHAVGGELHLQAVIAVHLEVFGGGSARSHFCINHHDAVVGVPQANLVFGTYHAQRLYAAYFRFLYLEFLVAVIEGGSYGGHDHGLAGGHVGGAAHNLGRLSVAEVHGCDVQMVGVGMGLACEHFPDNYPAQASADTFHLLHGVAFKPHSSQGSGELPGGECKVDVASKPLI